MAKCPITGKENEHVGWCFFGEMRSECLNCASCTTAMRLAWHWRRLRAAFVAVLLSLVFVSLGALQPALVLADHNVAHNCPAAVVKKILTCQASGKFCATVDGFRITWLDGTWFCVIEGAEPKTMYQMTNNGKPAPATAAERRFTKDAVAHGAVPVTKETAAQLLKRNIGNVAKNSVGRAAEGLLAAVPDVLLNPACIVYNAKGRMTNVCLDPHRTQ